MKVKLTGLPCGRYGNYWRMSHFTDGKAMKRERLINSLKDAELLEESIFRALGLLREYFYSLFFENKEEGTRNLGWGS